ncbi:hypothetical protein GLOTRDRAFT_138375 [Gloeophyllum trabeum ATCC 11539]|uniref:Uncharacterized protein n=1 Tax=Gloeophyllum trabeum (strain ATCC 11539 / FP-39264 / Madison 617) TaxID=670483 RepID=S7RQ52_GLOTA|nr:uncharacterized protein GLOTRDRAFT_138375 [Gloeophyllum trabeum ATCC 11539]EPQ56720.1 hypothetical protein GLOTRDRAFT_138375 [Gloeophyllum trabeum ATCC 11539]
MHPQLPVPNGATPTSRQHNQAHFPSSSLHTSHLGQSSRRPVNYSGNISDSSSHGLSSRLDMKRLLSKPAAPSHSGSSIISLPSDSEPAPVSPTFPRKERSASDHDRSPMSTNPEHSRGREVMFKSTSLLVQPSLGRKREPSASRPSTSREASSGAQYADRKPSSSRFTRVASSSSSSPTTPIATVVPSTKSAAAATTRRPSVPSLTIDPSYGSRPGTSPADRSIGRAAGRRYHGSGTTTKRRDTVANTSAPSTPTIGLTPAGAVAAAYKQQEQRREKLVSMTTEDDQYRPKSRSLDDPRDVEPSTGPERGAEASPTPYYTVFGSTSGKVVAVGGPDDHDWTYTAVYAERSDTTLGRTSSPAGVKRSLSRKVSASWRRGKGIPRRDSSPDVSDRAQSAEGSKITLQERRSASMPKERRKSLRLSIDDFAERRVVDPLLTGRSLSAGRRNPSASNWGEDSVGTSGDDLHESRRAKPSKLVKAKDPKKKEKEEEGSPGGKLWKLMKRISTGGLRERYASGDFSPPPVPALPKEYLPQSPARSAEAIDSPERGVGLARFIQSRPSMAVSRSPVSSAPYSVEGSRSAGGPRRASNATSGNRPSTTTRSSSPVSSDRTSSKFFHRTHSTRSSSSSYGEEIPPVPSGKVAQHIIPPSELYRLNSDESHTRSPPQELYTPSPNDDSSSSLPCPPRRPGGTPKGSSSPVVAGSDAQHEPQLSGLEPLSAATLSHLSPQSSDGDTSTWTSPVTPASGVPLSEFGVRPPPRPPRSSQRPQGRSSSSNESHSGSHSGTLGPSTLPSFRFTPTEERDNPLEGSSSSSQISRDRDSYGASSNASTTKGRPRSNSLGSRADTPSRSGLMFREFGGPASTHRWTEREKAEKWDELLERSTRAGGTLHIGTEGLLSDNIRFSQYSDF